MRNVKKIRIMLVVLCVFVVLSSSAMADAIATFDDLSLATDSYWNGSDGSSGFISDDVWFTNTYDAKYYSWDGFAYSNKTDTTTPGFTNQYSAITAGGVHGSANYGVGFVGWATPPQTYNGYMSGEYAQAIEGAYFTNTTYAYLSMLNGDDNAKKFGGELGDDADWFKLTVTGLNANYEAMAASVDFYLADYRFADNSQDYIISDWTWIDLSSLGEVYGLEFTLSSSDNGTWGMNTPAYFAIDNIVPEPATMCLLALGGASLIIRRRK